MITTHLDEAAIRDAAYYLWLDEGRPEGRDQDLWYRAMDALKAPTPKAKRKPAAKRVASAKGKASAKPSVTSNGVTAAKKPRKATKAN